MVWMVLVACQGLDGSTQISFADDLRAALPGWYELHGADATGSGGNTLDQAVAAVDEALVEPVTDSEEDPYAYDLGTYEVWRHPDVVWPGSDIVWFGAYERESGQLVEVYDFN